MVYIFLATGFEEIEAITVIDMLRRARIDIKTVSTEEKIVIGAHGIPISSDILESEIDDKIDAIILPGGMPGTLNLEKSQVLRRSLAIANQNNKLIAAICAAPSILGHLGLLKGKKATCYDGYIDELSGAFYQPIPVVRDGNIITAFGAGAAVDFACEIIRYFKDNETAQRIKDDMKCY